MTLLDTLKEYEEFINLFREKIVDDSIAEYKISKAENINDIFEITHYLFNAFMYHIKHDDILEDVRYEKMLYRYVTKHNIKLHDIYNSLLTLKKNTKFYLNDDENVPNYILESEIEYLFDEIFNIVLELLEDIVKPRVQEPVEEPKVDAKVEKNLPFEHNYLPPDEQAQLVIEQNKMAQIAELLNILYDQWKAPIHNISTISSDIYSELAKNALQNKTVLANIAKVQDETTNLEKTLQTLKILFDTKDEAHKTNLSKILDQVVSIINLSLASNNIEIITDYHFTDTIYTYEQEILLVILNIMKNAEKALVKDQIDMPIIVLVGYQDEEFQYIEIMNNGGEIPENIIEKIFEPEFLSTHQAKQKGIGLSISRDVVENKCKGELSAQNIDGGVKFVIALPRLNS